MRAGLPINPGVETRVGGNVKYKGWLIVAENPSGDSLIGWKTDLAEAALDLRAEIAGHREEDLPLLFIEQQDRAALRVQNFADPGVDRAKKLVEPNQGVEGTAQFQKQRQLCRYRDSHSFWMLDPRD